MQKIITQLLLHRQKLLIAGCLALLVIGVGVGILFLQSRQQFQPFSHLIGPSLSPEISIDNQSGADLAQQTAVKFVLPSTKQVLPYAQAVAARLGLENYLYREKLQSYQWSGKGIILTFYTQDGQINYAYNPDPAANDGKQKITDAKFYLQTLQDFLELQLQEKQSFDFTLQGYSYLKSGDAESSWHAEANLDNSDTVETKAPVLLDGKPVKRDGASNIEIQAYFDPYGQLISLNYPWGVVHAEKRGSTKIEAVSNLNELLKNPSAQKVVFLKSFPSNLGSDLKNIVLQNLTIQKVMFGYYLSIGNQNSTLTPAYILEGEVSDGQQTYPAVIYLAL